MLPLRRKKAKWKHKARFTIVSSIKKNAGISLPHLKVVVERTRKLSINIKILFETIENNIYSLVTPRMFVISIVF